LTTVSAPNIIQIRWYDDPQVGDWKAFGRIRLHPNGGTDPVFV